MFISRQSSRSVIADKVEQVERTKFELEVIETVDCFTDGHSVYTII